MHDPALNRLSLAYRCAYSVAGSYVAARLAPRNPMRHAMTVGMIELAASLVGAIVATSVANLGPDWYPIALVLAALPCAWLGGTLCSPRAAASRLES